MKSRQFKAVIFIILIITTSSAFSMRSQVCTEMENAYRSAQSNLDYYNNAYAGAVAAEDWVGAVTLLGYIIDAQDEVSHYHSAMVFEGCDPHP